MGGSGKGKDAPTTSSSATATSNPDVVRDNYIPLFDGQPSSYKEYRKRVALYYKKMSLANKKTEAPINLLTSLNRPVWKQVEHLAETAPDDENGFNIVLQELDRVYQYDSRVEMPKAFERFFYGVSRPYGQTLGGRGEGAGAPRRQASGTRSRMAATEKSSLDGRAETARDEPGGQQEAQREYG